MIIALAWLFVFAFLIAFPITLLLTPALGNFNAFELSTFVSAIVSPIIVGYICGQNIREESRTRTTADISVLYTVLVVFLVLIEASIAEWAPYIKADYLTANPTVNPSAFDWYNIQLSALGQEVFITVVVVFVFTFIGLYIGSQLKKPTKT